MTRESERPILEDGRPVMRDVRGRKYNGGNGQRNTEVGSRDMRCQNRIHDAGIRYTTQGSPGRLRIHRRHKRLETMICKEHRGE